jgi:hypothetical protein
MGDYQKDIAIAKLDKALEILDKLTSKDRAWVAPEFEDDLKQATEMIRKAKEHIANV